MGGKIDDNWSTFTTAEAIESFCEEFHPTTERPPECTFRPRNGAGGTA
jgi:hypothetical protein